MILSKMSYFLKLNKCRNWIKLVCALFEVVDIRLVGDKKKWEERRRDAEAEREARTDVFHMGSVLCPPHRSLNGHSVRVSTLFAP
jgi:hypothetical protein